ncbi:MAG: C39 family peptidase [Pseudomonadota bacterium]
MVLSKNKLVQRSSTGIRFWRSAIASAAIAVCAHAPAHAVDLAFLAGGANVQMAVGSIQARKFETVVQQQYDFSCGSAAVATLLTHHYKREISETDVFKAMWEVGDKDRIRELGFSLFEMKAYIESLGLIADGYQLPLDRVEQIGVPGIALINDKGYMHFVVIKGISKAAVLVGDPSRGIRTIKKRQFEKIWDGTILFVRSDVQRGKEGYNAFADWRLMPGAPYDRALDVEALQAVTLSQTRPSFSGFGIQYLVDTP